MAILAEVRGESSGVTSINHGQITARIYVVLNGQTAFAN